MLITGAVHINIDYMYHTFVYDTMWHKITKGNIGYLLLIYYYAFWQEIKLSF